MSLLGTVRSHGRHRGKSPSQLRRELDTALCELSAQATRVSELWAERNELEAQLDTAGIDLSGVKLDLEQATTERDALRAELANRDAITVPPMERDTSDGADQATQPIPVITLAQAFAGPVIAVAGSSNPTNIPQQRKGAA